MFSQRYERGSSLVTTNLPFDEWTEVFGSEIGIQHPRDVTATGSPGVKPRLLTEPTIQARLTWAHRAPPRQPVEGTPRRTRNPPVDYEASPQPPSGSTAEVVPFCSATDTAIASEGG